ncbi:MAG: N-acetyl-gamma-glutamyl-phosphate reductase [Candidatus Omnitrophica bacterium]|nr:N-acetyl-gamma-glutamyl-phosphate reductase [Candidatus Omnitrophota bacterium]
MPPIRVAIAGATGYAGEELIRLLLNHQHVRLTYLAASAKWERSTSVSEVFPRFAGRLDLPIESLDPARLAASADAVFLALPHGESMRLVPSLLKAGKRVIDLAGDFRLRDPSLYPQWYAFDHAAAEWLSRPEVVYGLSEFHREEIQRAKLIANPGCYATSVLLACLPLFAAKLVEGDQILVDAKSGFSGAGRKPELAADMAENLRPYKVNHHQHMPEITQEIHQMTGRTSRMAFVPQALSIERGLISTLFIKTRAPLEAVAEAYRVCYTPEGAPFVTVRVGSFPQLRDVVETNDCQIGLSYDAAMELLIVMSALDNLTKGAAGQAIQNFNLMHGFPETTALR